MLRNLYQLDKIKGDNYRSICPETVDSLCKSIKEVGLQEPIRLFEIDETKELFVISGHHRLEAMRRILKEPEYSHKIFQAYVVCGTREEYDSQKTAIQSVIANMLRKDLVLVDRARAYKKLKDQGISATSIGHMVDKDKRTIEMTLNVAILPNHVLDFIYENPKLKESTVYKLAVAFKKDPQFDILSELKDALLKQRAGTVVPEFVRIKKTDFREKLTRDGGFSPENVEKIMAILELQNPTAAFAPKAKPAAVIELF